MPALHSAGIRVRLATVPLQPTLTRNIVLRKGEVAAQHCETAETELRKSQFLDEERVVFPGDGEGFAMNWLAGAPFLMVKTGGARRKDGSRAERIENKAVVADGMTMDDVSGTLIGQPLRMLRRSQRSSSVAPTGSIEDASAASKGRRTSSPATRAHPHTPATVSPAHLHLNTALDSTPPAINVSPQALVLHVMLTEKTLYPSIIDGTLQHIKIEVFFNGRLSSCVLVHQNDIRAGAKSLHQIFAGDRVDFLVERPWIIHMSEKEIPGASAANTATTGAQNRWKEVCGALMKGANERGADSDGERPPTGQYLKNLANMQMPDAVSGMQKPGGKTFGVVDVVVTVGTGRKITSGVPYLKAPMRLVDERYHSRVDEEAEKPTEIRKDLHLREQERGSIDSQRVEDREAGVTQVDGHDDRNQPLTVKGGTESFQSVPSTRVHPHAQPPRPIFRNPFTGSTIPLLSPSGPYIYPGYRAPSAGLFAPPNSLDGPPSRKRPYSEFVAPASDGPNSSAGGQSHAARSQAFPSAHAPSSVPRNPKQLLSPSSGFYVNQYDGFAHANPYQLPYAGMMGLDVTGLPTLDSFDGPTSSPLRDQASGQLVLPSISSSFQQESNQMQGLEPTNTPSTPSPFSMPGALSSQARRNSIGGTDVTSVNTGPTLNNRLGAPSMPAGQHNLPRSAHFSSPLAQRTFGYPGPQQYFHMSSFMRQPLGPGPPIGYFKPTPKPKTKTVLPIDPGLIDISQPRPSILVGKLTITGLDGTVIVNHEWKIPQRIAASRRADTLPVSHGSSSRSRKESLGSSEYVESSDRPRRKHGSTIAIATPPPTSPTNNVPVSELAKATGALKRDSVHDKQSAAVATESHSSLPLLAPKAPAEEATLVSSSSLKDDRNVDVDAASHSLASAVTTRRTLPKGVLSVQGPKANGYVFDNPEELLRRKRVRTQSHSRSVSPIKAGNTPAELFGSSGKEFETKKDERVAASDMCESSPLSSLPASPDMRHAEDSRAANEVSLLPLIDASTSGPFSSLPSVALPPSSSFPQLPTNVSVSSQQARMSSIEKTTTTSHNPLVSSMKLRSTPAPSSPAITTPSASHPIATSKTRKTEKASARRQRLQDRPPRSPDRLSTSTNPSLNQNCVIQLAQSGVGLGEVQGKAGGGLLRQVKSERQGIFAEESVVVGVRFFVGA